MMNKIKNYKSFADRLAATNAKTKIKEVRPPREEAKKIGEFIHVFQEYITDEKVEFPQASAQYLGEINGSGNSEEDRAAIVEFMERSARNGIYSNRIRPPTLSEIILDLKDTLHTYQCKLDRLYDQEKRKL